MKLEYYPLEKLRHEIRTIVGLQVDLERYHLVFFGSRVRGESNERVSDIDIGLFGPEPIDLIIMHTLREQLNTLPTPYRFDLVDLSQTRDTFRIAALKTAEAV